MIAVGVGFSSRASVEQMVALVRQALEISGVDAEMIAYPAFKRDIQIVEHAADKLRLDFLAVSDETIEKMQIFCKTKSYKTFSSIGYFSISEACALGVLGERRRLLLPRIGRGGVTCALATDQALEHAGGHS